MNSLKLKKITERLVNNWTLGHFMLTLNCIVLLLIPTIAGSYLDTFSNIALIFFGIVCLGVCILTAIINVNDDCE